MRRLLICSALAAGLAMGVPALAQEHAPGPGPGHEHGDWKAMREAHMRQRAEDLRTILRIRPDQEAAFTAYLKSHEHGGPGGMEKGRKDGHGPGAPPMTTPQRLDAMARREAEHEKRREEHAQALKTFYAALSPEQQKVFDALQRMHGPHGGPRGPHFGMPMGGMGRGGPDRGPGGPGRP